jgi:uncharacterized FlaG/YvyC family protein
MQSDHLQTLYRDFATKVKSIATYLEKVKAETGEINQATYAFIGKLKKKYDTLEQFQQSRQHAIPSSQFSVEVPPSQPNPTDDSSIQKADKEINDASEHINYLFQKSEKELNFLVQSFIDLQDLVKSIYENFGNAFEKM